MDRRQLVLSLPAAALALGATGARAGPGPLLAQAIASPLRSEKFRERDRYRHPAASLAFWGLRPGMTVVEIDPDGGYWTEILAPYLKAGGGRYIAAVGAEGSEVKTRFADPAIWGRIEVEDFGPKSGPLAPPGTVDLVLTGRNVHNWMWVPGFVEKAFGDFHACLKRGGILALEEHRADPRPMVPEARDGYVATKFVVDAARAAGLRLEASSEINANPRDDKNHPFGVWTLPPTLRNHARGEPTPAGFDEAKYLAIGESDRMTLRFRNA
ncbi:MAG: class I SAM-dependent methyltransferase [Caulobacteraceae bacterium]